MSNDASPDTRTHYWKKQIDAWQASGHSQLAFCKANDLNYPRFGYWLRKFRRQGRVTGAVAQRTSGFVPVIAQRGAGELTIWLPNGIELRGVTADNLSVVGQLLARACVGTERLIFSTC